MRDQYVAMVAIIMGNVVFHGAEKFSWEFLAKAPEQGMTGGGIFPAIFGTAALVILMTIAVIPLGVATAVYMHEYAPKRSRTVHLVRLAIRTWPACPPSSSASSASDSSSSVIGRGMDHALYGESWSTASRRSCGPP